MQTIPEDTAQFLYHLWAGSGLPAESFFTFTAIHPDRKHPAPSRHLERDDRTCLIDNLKALRAANALGWGAFVGIAARREGLTRWQRGGRQDLLALPALFVDIDRPPLEALRDLRRVELPPSCLVTSGRGVHAYWWLRPATRELDTAQAILSALARRVCGDRLSVAQSMRLPGSVNTKHGRACRLAGLHPERRYALEDFAEFLPRRSKPIQRSNARHGSPACAYSVGDPQINPALIRQVEAVLLRDYGGFRRENGWIGALCPGGHARDRPGQHFYFNPVLGMGHCFGRHGRLLMKDLLPLLGLGTNSSVEIYACDDTQALVNRARNHFHPAK